MEEHDAEFFVEHCAHDSFDVQSIFFEVRPPSAQAFGDPEAVVEQKRGEETPLVVVDGNCPPDKHEANKVYAFSRGVLQMNLFAGWYDSLGDLEIRSFAREAIDAI